jgi:hypothetical protein
MPEKCSSISQASEDFNALVDELHPSQLKPLHQVQFLQAAFAALQKRSQDESRSVTGRDNMSSSAMMRSSHEEDLYSSQRLIDARQPASSSWLSFTRLKGLLGLSALTVAANASKSTLGTPTNSDNNSNSNSNGRSSMLSPVSHMERAADAMKRTGTLVTVRCGHNGWPSPEALAHVLAAFETASVVSREDVRRTQDSLYGGRPTSEVPTVYQD